MDAVTRSVPLVVVTRTLACLVAAMLLASRGSSAAAVESETPQARAAKPWLLRGDAAWERREEGFDGALAAIGPIGEAVAAYEQAFELDPTSAEVCYKLEQSLWFHGEYATPPGNERRRFYVRGRQVGEHALDVLGERVGGRRRLDGMSATEIARALDDTPWAGRLYLVTAGHWGLWASVAGPFAAVRTGALGKMRDYLFASLALEPGLLNGAAYRLLGRLYTETPRVPLVSGWVDHDRGVASLRRALELYPDEPTNRFFLAEALLMQRKGDPEAIDLLRGLLELEPRAEWLVEDATVRLQAEALLAGVRRR